MIEVKDPDLHRRLRNLGFEPHKAFRSHEFPGVYAHRGLDKVFPVLTLSGSEVTIFYPIGDEMELRVTSKDELFMYLDELVLKDVFES